MAFYKKKTKLKFALILFCIGAVYFDTWSQIVNYAIEFSGASSAVINLGSIEALNGTSQFTFECHVKLDAWNVNSEIFNKTQDANHRLAIQLGAAEEKTIYFHISNGEVGFVAVKDAPLTVGQWHHIAMTYNGTTDPDRKMSVYIDGELMRLYTGENVDLPVQTATTSAPMLLGQGFDGMIDEVRLWDTELSASDIVPDNTIADGHVLYDHLIGYWRMDQHINATSIIDYKSEHHGVMRSEVERKLVEDNPSLKYHIVSGYIRPHLYKAGTVSDDYLRHNTDIINLFAMTYDDGELFFNAPVSDGTITNANYLSQFAGRRGVLDLDGENAGMNAGRHLLNNVDGGITRFTFEAWIYLDSWTEGSFIFRNQQGEDTDNKIDLELGKEQQLLFHVNSQGEYYARVDNSGLSVDTWHHVAVVYNGGASGNQAQLYVDGVSKELMYSGDSESLPGRGPEIRGDFVLGVGLDAKFDEAMLFRFPMSQNSISSHMNNGINIANWPDFWVSAHWKFDNENDLGKDSQTWVNVYNGINAAIDGYEGIVQRIGTAGDWRKMISSPDSREAFSNNIRTLLDQYPQFKGVDIDFEWCENDANCWTDYAKMVEAVSEVLKPGETFSISLHPVSYKISLDAVSLVDFVSVQSYGPRPEVFPYEAYLEHIELFINYGFSEEKLVAGMPFYGVSDPRGSDVGYRSIVDAFPSLNPNTDRVSLNRNNSPTDFVFNGVNTIRKKIKQAKTKDFAGAMYWDTAVDADYSHPLSLLKALNAEMTANVQVPVEKTVEIPVASKVEISHTTLPPLSDQLVLSVDDFSENEKLLIYPNPSTGYVNIRLPAGSGRGTVEVLDLNGKSHYTMPIIGQQEFRLKTSQLRAGLYVVKFFDSTWGKYANASLIISKL
ncbi:MAG: glycosyl hydrolase family 18 protein [Cytophagales bacterium]|nr:glycosyl hydrolase family 18 protein [Cytophagales bacterium]